MSKQTADQGEFFFAFVKNSAGKLIPHPVFILGKHDDSNDALDVIACLVTSQGKRTDYDIETLIRNRKGWARSNKILTIERNSLDNKMPSPDVSDSTRRRIVSHAVRSISFKRPALGIDLEIIED